MRSPKPRENARGIPLDGGPMRQEFLVATRSKPGNIDLNAIMVPAARETFFNKRTISSSHISSRKQFVTFRGQLKSAIQSPRVYATI